MTTRILLIVAALLVSMLSNSTESTAGVDGLEYRITVEDTDWPWWRGRNYDGIVAANQAPPVMWDKETNVLWKSSIPGRGHGSPTVVGERIFLATADEEREIQSVLCYDRESGRQLWKTDIHQGGFMPTGWQGHEKSSKASSTVACDGQRMFISFFNQDAVYTTALSLDGKQLWQKRVCDYLMHQGFGSSPAIYGPMVIVLADHKGGGTVTAFDRLTGDVVWTNPRPKLPNYSSPVILSISGKDQLLLTGCNLISSLEPLTGSLNWEVAGSTEECVASTATDGRVVVTSGGYPDKHTSVVRADGSGDVLWKNNTDVYVPSMLIHNGYLYTVTDGGTAHCYELETGKPAWRHRLGRNFAASPILVGEQIFVTSEEGTATIFKADPQSFELVAENKLADEVFATPTICGNRIYLRAAVLSDNKVRQEMLYCVGVRP